MQRKHLSLATFDAPEPSRPGVHLAAAVHQVDQAEGGPSVNTSADCSGNNPSVSIEDEEIGTPDPKAITEDFDITDTQTEDEPLESWPSQTVSVQDVDDGVCSVEVSLKDASAEGFDMEVSIDNPIPPVHLSIPGEVQTYSVTNTYHYAVPCDQGTWSGTSEVEIPGFSTVSSGTSTFTTTQTNPTGGGPVQIELGADSADVTSHETLHSIETDTAEIVLGDAPPSYTRTERHVTYTRHITATGDTEALGGDEDEVPLSISVSGLAALEENGSFIGPRSETLTTGYTLSGTINCESHQLTLEDDKPFGAITLNRTSAAPPQLQSTTTVRQWRTQFLTDTATPPAPTPTPPPTTTVPPTPTTSAPPGPVKPLAPNVLGASQTQWNQHHRKDPAVTGNYDPQPAGTYPGSFTQDRFVGVSFVGGEVSSYAQQFALHTDQSRADQAIKQYLPADASLAAGPANLGPCGAEEWTSASLAASQPAGSHGVVSVTFTDSYALGQPGYSAADVRQAFVQITPGPVTPLTKSAVAVCG